MKKISLFSLCLFQQWNIFSQNINVIGYTPGLSQTTPLGKKTDWSFFSGTTLNPANLKFGTIEYPAADIRLQIGNSFIYKPQNNIALALGFLYQRNFPFDSRHRTEYRPYQQATISHNFSKLKITHRLRFSERFIENTAAETYPITTMLQYMTAFQVPLKGKSITPKQFYVTGYTEEYLIISGANKYKTFSEFWGHISIGYYFKKWGKLQIGITYEWVIRNPNLDVRHLTYPEAFWSTNFDIFKL